MRSIVERWTGSVVIAAVALALAATLATAQEVPVAAAPVDRADAALSTGTTAAGGAATRPTLTVTDFEYGTVAAQISGDKRTRKQLEKMGVRDTHGFAAQLGVGAADLIVEKLVAAGAFRVLERKQLAAIEQERGLGVDSTIAVPGPAKKVTRARYIVSGSVTRLGFEEKTLGGALGRAASTFVLYGLGAKKSLTEVYLTARVIDTETGEIVASFTGEGASDKGWGLTIFGMGGWGLGGAQAGSSNIRESAIGEATERAAQNIAERILRTRHGAAAGMAEGN